MNLNVSAGPGAAPGPDASTDASTDAAGQAAIALDDALYYLRRGCEPCAERHFDRARRYGATGDQIEAVRATARAASVRPAPADPG